MSYFLGLFINYPEATDPISQISVSIKVFTILNGFYIYSRPAINFHSCFFLVSMTLLGLTDNFSM